MKRITIFLGMLLLYASALSNANFVKDNSKDLKNKVLPLIAAPTIDSGQSFTIDENSAAGTVIGKIDTTTAGGNAGTLTWSISSHNPDGDENDAFEITQEGELRVLDPDDIDYETNQSFEIIVTITDDSSEESATVTVNLNDLNDNAPVINNASPDINENATDGDLVVDLDATDADTGTTFSNWTLSTTGNTDTDLDGQRAFRINDATGEITINDAGDLDYETTQSYTLRVTVSDGTYTSAEKEITVTINNINDIAPVIDNASFSISENISQGDPVGTLSATDEDGPDLTNLQSWTLLEEGNTSTDGDQNGPFTINSSSGEISINDAGDIDYETTTSYTLRVTVNDGTYTSEVKEITVTVTNVNDGAPVIDDATFSISEDIAQDATVGTLSATDDDPGTTLSSWTILEEGNTSTDGDSDLPFAIDPSSGQITINDSGDIDYETTTSYTLKITVSDGTNTSAEKNITINVTDINDNAPAVTTASFTISEDITDNSEVGTLSATDNDTETTFSEWTILEEGNTSSDGDNNRPFAIDPSTGVITINDAGDIDYETTTSYTLKVTVSDGTNTSSETDITININDINDVSPVITADQSFSIPENSAVSNVVGTVEATDGDASTTTFTNWTITQNANYDGDATNAFNINPNTGEITVNDQGDLDYEKNKSIVISVSVSDGRNPSASVPLTINLTDENDNKPTIEESNFSINDGIAVDENVGTPTATDVDEETTFQNWTLLPEGNDSSDGDNERPFKIDESTGQITINDADDIDSKTTQTYSLKVTVSDGVNTSDEAIVNITVNEVNEVAPVVTADQSFSIDENSTNGNTVGTVVATDADPGTTSFQEWTISKNVDPDGDETNAFSINASTGVLTVTDVSDLDRETTDSLVIEITVSDGKFVSNATEVVIKLNDINDNIPVITDPKTFSISENDPFGHVIGQLTATDNDVTETTFQNWTIVQNYDPGSDTTPAFNINSSTGELTIADTNDINYESVQSIDIVVTVSDGVNTSEQDTITINITDENDNAPVITLNQSFDIAENSPEGTAIGTIEATDVDANTTFQDWTITQNVDSNGDGKDAFSIDASSGEISINDSTEFNAEENSLFTIWVTVSDGTNVSTSDSVNINITDVNDIKPVITSGLSFTLDEHLANNTEVGTIEATDGDVTETTFSSWTIVKNINLDNDDDYAFAIDPVSGIIRVVDSDDLDYETFKTDTITITVSDGVNTSDTTDVIINLNDLNDIAPVITADQVFTIDENLSLGSVVDTIQATDGDVTVSDLRDWHTNTIIDPNGNDTTAFVIDSLTGIITVNDPGDLDYEQDTTFSIWVTVSDSINTSDSTEIIIKLRDLNDIVPVITADQVFTINENLANDSLVGTVVATDDDITETTFQDWKIIETVNESGDIFDAFKIDASSGNITVADSTDLDYEQDSTFTVKLTVSDGVNTSDTTNVTINLVDLNDEIPVVEPNQLFYIDENSEKDFEIDTIVASDADVAATVFDKWRITTNIDPNGNDTMAFAIDSMTGILLVNDPKDLDREANEELAIYVTVWDGRNTSLPEKVTIKLNDLNDVVPVVTANQEYTIEENTPNGTLLGTLVATDGDVTPTTFNNWTISTNSDADGDGNGAFALDTLTGELTINDVGDIDMEKNQDITIEVTVSDSVNTSEPQQVIVHLTDLNDVLPEVIKGQEFIIEENVENAVSVGFVEVSDGDVTPTTFSNWEITTNVDPDKDGIPTFSINPNNGELFVNDADEIDFETNSKFFIAVSVFDGINTGIPRAVTIHIDNLEDEIPVITKDQVFYINEDAVRKTVVGIVEATDKDKGMVVLQDWTIVNNPDPDEDGRPAFKIDDETGEITVNDTDDIDYELNNEISLDITVSDGTNISEVETVLVKINRILGIEDEIRIEFSIYPNPVVDYATLTTKVKGNLLIINDKGQQIKQMNIKDYQTQISVQDLRSGIYYFVFITNRTKITKKIIIKNR